MTYTDTGSNFYEEDMDDEGEEKWNRVMIERWEDDFHKRDFYESL